KQKTASDFSACLGGWEVLKRDTRGGARLVVWAALKKGKKRAGGGVGLRKKTLGVWGGGAPASPEWLSLNAPLSMARALRAIAFNP
ncbi:hypothetical protein NS19R_16860, partial [Enterobacter hormaechei subsp. xiangfangensis]